jgi:hypothetical protein
MACQKPEKVLSTVRGYKPGSCRPAGRTEGEKACEHFASCQQLFEHVGTLISYTFSTTLKFQDHHLEIRSTLLEYIGEVDTSKHEYFSIVWFAFVL